MGLGLGLVLDLLPLPLGEGWGEGLGVKTGFCTCYTCAGSYCFRSYLASLGLAGRGCPAATYLFFASPKKSRQKKGDPAAWVPALRYGQPVLAEESGGRARTRLRLRQSLALIPLSSASTGPARTGGEQERKREREGQTSIRFKLPRPDLCPPSAAPGCAAHPRGPARAPRCGRRCRRWFAGAGRTRARAGR